MKNRKIYVPVPEEKDVYIWPQDYVDLKEYEKLLKEKLESEMLYAKAFEK